MKIKHLMISVLGLLVFLVACGDSSPIEENMSETVPDFSYTTQDEETLELEDLKGNWWIADFIFTNCTDVCIPMTNNMAILQDEMKAQDLDDVQLVSFTVDPDFDTPDVLKEHAERNAVDLKNWHFLTGYDFQTIKELSIKTFGSLVKEPQPGDDQVMHGTSFFLVNPDGEVVKKYSGLDKKAMDEIIEDLQKVAVQ